MRRRWLHRHQRDRCHEPPPGLGRPEMSIGHPQPHRVVLAAVDGSTAAIDIHKTLVWRVANRSESGSLGVGVMI